MGLIEILDTEGNIHLIRPDEISGISDIREYRIIYTSNKDFVVITNLKLDIIKRRIRHAQKRMQRIDLLGGINLPYDEN